MNNDSSRVEEVEAPNHSPPSARLTWEPKQLAFGKLGKAAAEKPERSEKRRMEGALAKELVERVIREVQETAEEYTYDRESVGELGLLSSVEFLLTENRVEDALKAVRWRKKLLKVAALNGWEVAHAVAKNTLSKLDIDERDLINVSAREPR